MNNTIFVFLMYVKVIFRLNRTLLNVQKHYALKESTLNIFKYFWWLFWQFSG